MNKLSNPKTKYTLAAVAGTALECYDNSLYFFFAVILGPLFFPSESRFVVMMGSFGALAAGFIARPLGGIMFGHLGDKLGRKQLLTLAIFLVTLPTLVIGLLPTYAVIGIWAPILLISCRLLQGFCIGGELGGAMTYVVEQAKPNRRGFAASFIAVSSYGGAVLGTAIGTVCTLSFMPIWGWRIPFLMGALFGLIGFYIRNKLAESPEFLQTKQDKQIVQNPIAEILKHQKASVFRAAGIAAGVLVPFFVVSSYIGEILVTEMKFSSSQLLFLNTCLMLFWAFLSPIMGWISDKIGIENLMQGSALGVIITAFPAFWLLKSDLGVPSILAIQLTLSIFCVGFSAPCSAFLTRLFPVNARCSGIGFGYATGCALLGGVTPLIATGLVYVTGSSISPAFYLALCGIISLYSVKSFKETTLTQDSTSQEDIPFKQAA